MTRKTFETEKLLQQYMEENGLKPDVGFMYYDLDRDDEKVAFKMTDSRFAYRL